MSVILLDPSDEVIVTFDWSDELAAGVSLVSVTHNVPAPLTKLSESTNTAAGTSAVKISGAVHGRRYMIEAHAMLSNDERINRQYPALGWNS